MSCVLSSEFVLKSVFSSSLSGFPDTFPPRSGRASSGTFRTAELTGQRPLQSDPIVLIGIAKVYCVCVCVLCVFARA